MKRMVGQTKADIGCHVLRSGGLVRPKAILFPQAAALLHGEYHCSPAVPCALAISLHAVQQLSTLTLICFHYTCQHNTCTHKCLVFTAYLMALGGNIEVHV